MKSYKPICICKNGKLSDKVNLKPDFFSGFDPHRRTEIVREEAEFYRQLTKKYSVDDRLTKKYVKVRVRDGVEIPVKMYRPSYPKSAPLSCFLFIHGGGYITCSVETHDFVPSYIAANAGCVCFSIEYRLAPEFKFPKGLDDCYDVAKWIADNAAELGINASKISVGGDSSGGNFAAVLAQTAKENGEFSFDKQVLIYPVTDFSNENPKESAKFYAPIGASDGGKAAPPYMKMYLPDDTDLRDPRISPLLREDLHGLPSALFILAECDPLRDDGLYYAEALKDSGVKVDYHIFEGMPHAFILRTYEETFEALNEICTFIKE